MWPEHISLFISVFALIVLSTFTFHRLVIESRIKILESEVRELKYRKTKDY